MTRKEIVSKLQINRLLIQSSNIAVRVYRKAIKVGASVGLALSNELLKLEELNKERQSLRDHLRETKKGGASATP